jgi:hypothetical protein
MARLRAPGRFRVLPAAMVNTGRCSDDRVCPFHEESDLYRCPVVAERPPGKRMTVIAPHPDERIVGPGRYAAARVVARYLGVRDLSYRRRVLIDCAPDNAPSIRAIEKAGFRRIADTDACKIGPFNFYRVNAGRWRVMSRCLDPHALGS